MTRSYLQSPSYFPPSSYSWFSCLEKKGEQIQFLMDLNKKNTFIYFPEHSWLSIRNFDSHFTTPLRLILSRTDLYEDLSQSKLLFTSLDCWGFFSITFPSIPQQNQREKMVNFDDFLCSVLSTTNRTEYITITFSHCNVVFWI